LNEHLFYKQLRPIFQSLGLPIRLENTAATSVPDLVFLSDGVTMWIELKILRGQHVSMPKFQYAMGVQMSKQIEHDLFWILVSHGLLTYGIKYIDIIGKVDAKGDVVRFALGDVPHVEIPSIKGWLKAILEA